VSPPLLNVRGRNIATAGRYCGADRAGAIELLNREVECISRVIVHPVYRGSGLAVRLVRHALATGRAPLMEALAAMGQVNPFFVEAGMRAYHLGPDVPAARLISAAEAVGLDADDLAAVDPVRRLARRPSKKGRFLAAEIDHCLAAWDARNIKAPAPNHTGHSDPAAAACRHVTRQYVYYLGQTGRNRSWKNN